MLSAIDAHGDPGVQLPPGPPFFEFADPGNAAAALTAAGFAECSTHEVPQTLVLDAAADLWPMARCNIGIVLVHFGCSQPQASPSRAGKKYI